MRSAASRPCGRVANILHRVPWDCYGNCGLLTRSQNQIICCKSSSASDDGGWEDVFVDDAALEQLGLEEGDRWVDKGTGGDDGGDADDVLAELRLGIENGELVQLDQDVSHLLELGNDDVSELDDADSFYDTTLDVPDAASAAGFTGGDVVADLAEYEDIPAMKWSEATFKDESKAAADLEYLSNLDTTGLDAESLAILEQEMQRKSAEVEGDGFATSAPTERADESKQSDAAMPKRKTHRKLTVVAGACKGQKLLSPADNATRPMMGVVRGALFGMLASLVGASSLVDLPSSTRWLDLYAGTGAVGLEALSRGVGFATFVESDEWCVRKCLKPNLESTGSSSISDVHIGDVEPFLRQSLRSRREHGNAHATAYNFVSVCPPYRQVDYVQLLHLLEQSELIATGALITVEYPFELRHLLEEKVGRLEKVRDRRYGRTFVAVYSAA